MPQWRDEEVLWLVAPGPVLANLGVDNLRFLTPVKVDDTLT